MAQNATNKRHLPDELVLRIFSAHQLPSAAQIGRDRYEVINVPREPLLGGSGSFVDNDLHTGACTHDHDEWQGRLRTLSAISKCSKRFHGLALPLLYRVYPGQTLVNPQLFLRTIKTRHATLVKELVVDVWDNMNSPKLIQEQAKALGLGYAFVECLQKTAKSYNDETHAILLLFYCSNIEILDLTCPSAYRDDEAMLLLVDELRKLRPNTLAKSNEEASRWKHILSDLPLRKLRTIHLHHAEHHYIRKIDRLRPFMCLPTIQSVTLYRFWRDGNELIDLKHVRELTLWRCTFEPDKLLSALQACTELQSLTIIFAGCTSMWGRLSPVRDHPTFEAIGDIVRTKLKKLRKLILDDREFDETLPRHIGNLAAGPALEELAISEDCLGAYAPADDSILNASLYRSMANQPLYEVLPPTLRKLAIFRCNSWWHEVERGPRATEYTRDGLTFHFDAMHDKVFALLRDAPTAFPDLKQIHIDTPLEFAKDVSQFGWSCERVVGDPLLERPSLVADSMMKPEEKKTWKDAQDLRDTTPSVLLRRVGNM